MRAPRFIDPLADGAARVGDVNGEAWQLVLPEALYAALMAHLFPGDDDEHGAVVAAGVVTTDRGTRLLARNLFVAEDGRDFVASPRAHRRLTPDFVNRHIRFCRDESLVYLAIHNHGHGDAVGFSSIDLASHERGYPALIDIARGQPVGALVFATNAVAGDIWTPDGQRHPVAETVVLAANRTLFAPSPAASPLAAAAIDDRQARVFGAAGQAVLRRLKVGVIGGGGVGLPVVAQLSRLGVGHIVVVDPDRVTLTNLPRLPESTRRDAATWLTAGSRPEWIRRLGGRLATPKVRLAQRAARRARRDILCEGMQADVSRIEAAERLVDCDHLFLAADSEVARTVFNALVFGFLIPGTQIGSKVTVDADGHVGEIFSIVRPVEPDGGCLWCNGVISPQRLADELLPAAIRDATRYVPHDDAPAPSVITLNALGVARATHRFMLSATGLLKPTDTGQHFHRSFTRTGRQVFEQPRTDPQCVECGLQPGSLRARGARERIPRTNGEVR